jgi:hypothetical protein
MSRHGPTIVKACLRCDWEGETREAGCPNCGVPLYVVGSPAPSAPEAPPRDRRQEWLDEKVGIEPVTPADTSTYRSDPRPSEMDELGSSGRSGRSIAAFGLGALVLTFIVGAWFGATGGFIGTGGITRLSDAQGPERFASSEPMTPMSTPSGQRDVAGHLLGMADDRQPPGSRP